MSCYWCYYDLLLPLLLSLQVLMLGLNWLCFFVFPICCLPVYSHRNCKQLCFRFSERTSPCVPHCFWHAGYGHCGGRRYLHHAFASQTPRGGGRLWLCSHHFCQEFGPFVFCAASNETILYFQGATAWPPDISRKSGPPSVRPQFVWQSVMVEIDVFLIDSIKLDLKSIFLEFGFVLFESWVQSWQKSGIAVPVAEMRSWLLSACKFSYVPMLHWCPDPNQVQNQGQGSGECHLHAVGNSVNLFGTDSLYCLSYRGMTQLWKSFKHQDLILANQVEENLCTFFFVCSVVRLGGGEGGGERWGVWFFFFPFFLYAFQISMYSKKCRGGENSLWNSEKKDDSSLLVNTGMQVMSFVYDHSSPVGYNTFNLLLLLYDCLTKARYWKQWLMLCFIYFFRGCHALLLFFICPFRQVANKTAFPERFWTSVNETQIIQEMLFHLKILGWLLSFSRLVC